MPELGAFISGILILILGIFVITFLLYLYRRTSKLDRIVARPKICRHKCESNNSLTQLQQTVACANTKAALSVNSIGIIPEEDATYMIAWDNACVGIQSPSNMWAPVFSTDIGFTDQVIGYTVPATGAWLFNYNVGVITEFAFAILLVNGVGVTRSGTFLFDADDFESEFGAVMAKTFQVWLRQGDVVSILLIAPGGTNQSTAPSPGDPLNFATTMCLELIIPACEGDTNWCNADFTFGPNLSDSANRSQVGQIGQSMQQAVQQARQQNDTGAAKAARQSGMKQMISFMSGSPPPAVPVPSSSS